MFLSFVFSVFDGASWSSIDWSRLIDIFRKALFRNETVLLSALIPDSEWFQYAYWTHEAFQYSKLGKWLCSIVGFSERTSHGKHRYPQGPHGRHVSNVGPFPAWGLFHEAGGLLLSVETWICWSTRCHESPSFYVSANADFLLPQARCFPIPTVHAKSQKRSLTHRWGRGPKAHVPKGRGSGPIANSWKIARFFQLLVRVVSEHIPNSYPMRCHGEDVCSISSTPPSNWTFRNTIYRHFHENAKPIKFHIWAQAFFASRYTIPRSKFPNKS